ncbi:LysR family transcriptional regulator [Pseudoxanthobacter sp. M-2]|uniref:LysR family transcriptional regulator n=1 Tax=Pseudoxanthobacter sp. M-2 TaxID=3078754 RepID=UPI0038FC64FD
MSAREQGSGLDLRRLRYFVAVCESGGFSRAATVIGVAQPALTRQVKLLEGEVGLPLIIRTARGAEPTEVGRYLLAHARQHLEGLDGIVRELRRRFSDVGGPVVLGVCPTIAPFFLTGVITHLREAHPNLSLSVIQAYSGDLQSLLEGGRLDIALTYSPRDRGGCEVIDLFTEQLALVCARPLEGQVDFAAAARRKLVLPSRIHELRRIIDTVSARAGASLVPDLELDSLDAVKGVLAEGAGDYATILPEHSVRADVEAGRLFCRPFDHPEMRRTIAIVRPAAARNRSGADVIAAFVAAHSRQLEPEVATA